MRQLKKSNLIIFLVTLSCSKLEPKDDAKKVDSAALSAQTTDTLQEKIISVSTSDTETLKIPEPDIVETFDMVFIGDVMFGRYDDTGLVPNPLNTKNAFKYVKHLLKADLAVANLETPLLKEPFKVCPWPPRLRFAAGPDAADALVDAGFHAVTLSNNHVFDMRNKGVEDTEALLRERNIVTIGGAVPKGENPFKAISISVGKQKIAFIGITTVRNSVDGPTVPDLPYTAKEEEVVTLLAPVIEDARKTHDRVIVITHWGVSDAPAPTPRRRNTSRSLIDLGADAVIGHHPHVLQGVEIYNNGLIVHSLGDFLFDVLWDERRLTGVLKIEYSSDRKCPSKVIFNPVAAVQTEEGIIPKPARKFLLESVIVRMVNLSKKFGTTWEQTGDQINLIIPDSCK